MFNILIACITSIFRGFEGSVFIVLICIQGLNNHKELILCHYRGAYTHTHEHKQKHFLDIDKSNFKKIVMCRPQYENQKAGITKKQKYKSQKWKKL